MSNKYFDLKSNVKKKEKPKVVEESYDASIFTSGQGYVNDGNSNYDNANYNNYDNDNYESHNNYEEEKKLNNQYNNSESYSSAPSYENYNNFKEREEYEEERYVENDRSENYSSNNYQNNIDDHASMNMEVANNDVSGTFLTKESALKEPEIKNPVYVQEEEEEFVDSKVNIFTVLSMLGKSFVKPGSSIAKNVKRYKDTKKAILITVYITILIIILSLGVNFITGGFTKVYDLNTGSYSTVVDFGNILSQDYVGIVVGGLSLSFISILVVSIVYYALSFFRNKGVYLGTYVMISNLALFPFLFTVTVLYPLCILVNYYLGFLVILISLMFSIISFYNAIGETVEFENVDKKIFYNILAVSIIIIILIMVIVLFFENDFNEITNLINTYL